VRVLIVKLGSLGDVVHAMPAVHDILVAQPDAQVDWVVEPAFAPLVRRVEGIGDVIEGALRRWRQGWWTAPVRAEIRAFRARLQREHYDAIIDLQGLGESALVARLARGRRFGLANRTDGAAYEPLARWLVDDAITVERHIHAMDRARVLVGAVLGVAPAGAPQYGLRARPLPPRRADEPPTVTFVHGSARDERLWPDSHWVNLGKRVLAAGWRIALPQGNEAEHTRAELIASALQFDRAVQVEVWPSLALDAVLDRLAATQGVIGVDSGLSHLAVALNLPHLQLHNFETAWRTGPQAAHGRRHQVSLEGAPLPPLDAVWSAWNRVLAAAQATAA